MHMSMSMSHVHVARACACCMCMCMCMCMLHVHVHVHVHVACCMLHVHVHVVCCACCAGTNALVGMVMHIAWYRATVKPRLCLRNKSLENRTSAGIGGFQEINRESLSCVSASPDYIPIRMTLCLSKHQAQPRTRRATRWYTVSRKWPRVLRVYV